VKWDDKAQGFVTGDNIRDFLWNGEFSIAPGDSVLLVLKRGFTWALGRLTIN
jgi:hypothetical protein